MFRFTIRDVLWLTVVVAIFLGAYLEWRADLLGRRRDAETILKMKAELDVYRAIGIVPATQTRPPRGGLRNIPGDWDYQYPPETLRQLETQPSELP